MNKLKQKPASRNRKAVRKSMDSASWVG